MQRFKIEVSDDVLADLADRLARTRFPDQLEGAGWDYGTELSYLRELVAHWRSKYDWRAHERAFVLVPLAEIAPDLAQPVPVDQRIERIVPC